MANTFTHQLALHLRAGYPLIFVISKEEARARALIAAATEQAKETAIYPRTPGSTPKLEDLLGKKECDQAVVVLDDVHRRLDDPDVLRLLSDLGDLASFGPRAVVILAPYVDLPVELSSIAAIIDLPLPSPMEIASILNALCSEHGVIYAEADIKKLVRAAQGMTQAEATRAFHKAIVEAEEDADRSLASVLWDKQRSLWGSRVLQSIDIPPDLEDVGGLDRLKDWLQSRKEAFGEAARAYGLPAPRGLLLMGVQGCGKSLTAKAISKYWHLPLVRLDISAVFGTDHPEAALSGALRISEAMAPVVLWIDEIEKGFERGKGGHAPRLLGGMVTWLQEKDSEVFVVATANQVLDLPPELPRKGRFDEVFFVDLPNFNERCDILRLHLQQRGRDPQQYAIEALAKTADKYTGSELEQIIVSAMYAAFSRKDELSDRDLHRALKETVPLYDTFEEEIKALREWARRRARPASTDRRKIDLFSKK